MAIRGKSVVMGRNGWEMLEIVQWVSISGFINNKRENNKDFQGPLV